MAGTDTSEGQAVWQPGGAEEDSRLREGNRHVHLAYDEEEGDCTVKCLQHVRSSSLGPTVCKSCATHRALITCNQQCATWYEGTAQLLSLPE